MEDIGCHYLVWDVLGEEGQVQGETAGRPTDFSVAICNSQGNDVYDALVGISKTLKFMPSQTTTQV